MGELTPEPVNFFGTVLDGAYRIDGLLGQGGMGAVFSATHVRLERPVAVKVMAHELAASTEALARFHREAVVTSGLGHPNIVQVFDFSTTPTGAPYLVMEFLDGEDLERRLKRDGRLPASDVVHIVKQVASALTATHAKGIVHRDLKPANIYLLDVPGTKDFVKVLDFGISKVRSAEAQLTRTSAVMGTPNYMSPEQAKGQVHDIDERTDQWALACIVWECLCGERLFDGENTPSILFQIVHEPIPALTSKLPGLQPAIEDVLLRALAKAPQDRFPSVGEFAAALEHAVLGVTQAPGRSVPPTVQLPEAAVPDAKPVATTLSDTAGSIQMAGANPATRSSKWLAPAAMGALVVMSALLWLFRSGGHRNSVPVDPTPIVPAMTTLPVLAPSANARPFAPDASPMAASDTTATPPPQPPSAPAAATPEPFTAEKSRQPTPRTASAGKQKSGHRVAAPQAVSHEAAPAARPQPSPLPVAPSTPMTAPAAPSVPQAGYKW